MKLQTYVFELPIDDFTDVPDLIKKTMEGFREYLNEKDEDVLIHDPDGENMAIQILHPKGESWGDNLIKVKIEYTPKER